VEAWFWSEIEIGETKLEKEAVRRCEVTMEGRASRRRKTGSVWASGVGGRERKG
jgi:hypothetical protein